MTSCRQTHRLLLLYCDSDDDCEGPEITVSESYLTLEDSKILLPKQPVVVDHKLSDQQLGTNDNEEEVGSERHVKLLLPKEPEPQAHTPYSESVPKTGFADMAQGEHNRLNYAVKE